MKTPKAGKAAPAATTPAEPTKPAGGAGTAAVPPVLMPFAINHVPLPASLPRQARVAANAQYFDAIISLIPAAVYASSSAAEAEDGNDLADVNRKYFKHAKDPKEGKLASSANKERNSKQVRFGSESVSQSLVGKRPREPEDEAAAAVEGEIHYATSSHGAGPASSIEELRKRLQAKIAQLRSARKAGDDDDDDDDEGAGSKAAKPHQKQQQQQQQQKGTKPVTAATQLAKKMQAAAAQQKQQQQQQKKDKSQKQEAGVKRPADAAGAGGNPAKKVKLNSGAAAPGAGAAPAAAGGGDLDFAFGAIADGAGSSAGAGSAAAAAAAAPGSKKQKLHKLLKKASKREARLARLASKGEEGAQAAAAAKLTTSYDAALRKASGEKVLDDAGMLAKSLKRMKKQKSKSAEAWKERVDAVKTSQKERQVARQENIKMKKHRGVNQLAEKKAGDREKEREREGGAPAAGSSAGGAGAPPARPGFEGRKKKFLNK